MDESAGPSRHTAARRAGACAAVCGSIDVGADQRIDVPFCGREEKIFALAEDSERAAKYQDVRRFHAVRHHVRRVREDESEEDIELSMSLNADFRGFTDLESLLRRSMILNNAVIDESIRILSNQGIFHADYYSVL